MLNQSKPEAKFTWHRDTEEDTESMRVHYSVVLLLRKEGVAAGMRIAGMTKSASYSEWTGHIFNSAMFHKTDEVEGSGGVKIGVFVGLIL